MHLNWLKLAGHVINIKFKFYISLNEQVVYWINTSYNPLLTITWRTVFLQPDSSSNKN